MDIHYVYAGHFIPEDGFVRFEDKRPACSKPLNRSALISLIENRFGSSDFEAVLKELNLRATGDFLAGNLYGSRDALALIAEYARREQGFIIDMGAFTLVAPDELMNRK